MSQQLTVGRTELPFALRTLNQLAGAWLSMSPSSGLLQQESLLEQAIRHEGGRFDDFGHDGFMGPMARVIAEANRRDVCPLGRLSFRKIAVKTLVNRLRWTAYRKAHPEVEDIRIERPIFILGFPRTGTTLLQNLLTLEEGYRSLKFWELSSPTPVHPDLQVDQRKREVAIGRALWAAYKVAPEMAEVHEIRADTPEECWPLMANGWVALNYDLANGLTDFGEYLYDHDMVHAYTEYKQQLQMMAHRHPQQVYVLKCPEHLWFLDALLTVFPDADIIWTHRDPAASIASYCSLVSMARRSFYGSVDPHELGGHIRKRFHEGVHRAMDTRTRFPSARFFDVDFRDLVTDPISMVKRIRTYFDLEEADGAVERIHAWQNNDRQDKKGKHKYSADFYGLDIDAIHDEYADYIYSFDIPIKPSGM